ncbi:MAG: hypothetical protein Q9213_007260, partial [Squamulea squamosa]
SDPDGFNTCKPAIRIQGTAGEIQVDGPAFRPPAWRFIKAKGPGMKGTGEPEVEEHDCEIPGHGMFWEADECGRCLRDGRCESEGMGWEESVVIMEVMDEVRRQGGVKYPEKIESLEYPLNFSHYVDVDESDAENSADTEREGAPLDHARNSILQSNINQIDNMAFKMTKEWILDTSGITMEDTTPQRRQLDDLASTPDNLIYQHQSFNSATPVIKHSAMFVLLASTLFAIFLTFSVPTNAASPGDPINFFDRLPFGTAGPFLITDNLFNTFQLISQYAAAAYCPAKNDSPDTLLTCSSGNWKTDWDLVRVSIDFCDECHIHRGFKNSWHEVKHAVMENMKKAVKRHPSYRIIVTGHSLGGAIATIAAAELRRIDDHFARETELYTFGSPRIANKEAARWLSEQSPYSWRITNENDLVPRLPPREIGYHHMEPEYWISANGTHSRVEDVVWSNREDSSWGNEAEIVPSREAHHHYFRPISACSPNNDD